MKTRSGLALLLVIPVLALGACGDSDEDKITTLVEDVNKDPAKLCDNATEGLLKQVGGKAGCEKAAKAAPKSADVKVSSVEVNGDKASAKVASKVGGKSSPAQKVIFVKEDGDWKIDA